MKLVNIIKEIKITSQKPTTNDGFCEFINDKFNLFLDFIENVCFSDKEKAYGWLDTISEWRENYPAELIDNVIVFFGENDNLIISLLDNINTSDVSSNININDIEKQTFLSIPFYYYYGHFEE